jgi:hypothetical protein
MPPMGFMSELILQPICPGRVQRGDPLFPRGAMLGMR